MKYSCIQTSLAQTNLYEQKRDVIRLYQPILNCSFNNYLEHRVGIVRRLNDIKNLANLFLYYLSHPHLFK